MLTMLRKYIWEVVEARREDVEDTIIAMTCNFGDEKVDLFSYVLSVWPRRNNFSK